MIRPEQPEPIPGLYDAAILLSEEPDIEEYLRAMNFNPKNVALVASGVAIGRRVSLGYRPGPSQTAHARAKAEAQYPHKGTVMQEFAQIQEPITGFYDAYFGIALEGREAGGSLTLGALLSLPPGVVEYLVAMGFEQFDAERLMFGIAIGRRLSPEEES